MTLPKPMKSAAAKAKTRRKGAKIKPSSSDKVKNTPSEKNQKSNHTKRNTKKNQGADPEGLALSKNDIIDFCDRVIKKWQQDSPRNARNIPAMFAVRTSVLFSDETSLKAIWSEIISWVYQLLYENAQAQARKEGQEWAEIFSKLKR